MHAISKMLNHLILMRNSLILKRLFVYVFLFSNFLLILNFLSRPFWSDCACLTWMWPCDLCDIVQRVQDVNCEGHRLSLQGLNEGGHLLATSEMEIMAVKLPDKASVRGSRLSVSGPYPPSTNKPFSIPPAFSSGKDISFFSLQVMSVKALYFVSLVSNLIINF